MLTGALIKVMAKPIGIGLAMLVVATLRPFLRAIVFLVPSQARKSYLEHAAGFTGNTPIGFGAVGALIGAVALYVFIFVTLKDTTGDAAFLIALFPAIV